MAVLDRIWERLRPDLDRANELPPEDALELLLQAQLDLAFELPSALVLLVRELRHLPEDYRALALRNHRRYLDAWADALMGVEPGLERDTARGVASAVHGLIDSAALHRRVAPATGSPSRQRRLLEDLARAALAAGAGGTHGEPHPA